MVYATVAFLDTSRDQLGWKNHMDLEILILQINTHHHDIKDQALNATQMVVDLFLYPYPIVNHQSHPFFILQFLHLTLQFLGMCTLLVQDSSQALKLKLLFHQVMVLMQVEIFSLHHKWIPVLMLSILLLEDHICKNPLAISILPGIIKEHIIR